MNEYQQKLDRNIHIYYWSRFVTGFLFTIPIWVAFHLQFFNYTQLSLLLAAGYLITFLLEVPTGALADLIGRKTTIIAGNILTGIARMLVGFMPMPATLITGIIVESIGSALISGSETAILYDSLKELGEEKKYSRIVSRSILYRRIGFVLAIFAGGYLYQYSAGLPYILRGVTYILAGMFSLFLAEPHIDSITFSVANYLQQTKEGMKELVRSKYLKSLTLYYMTVAGTTLVCLDYFVNTFAKDSGYTEIEQSWAFSLMYIISAIVVTYVTGQAAHHISKRRVFILIPLMLILSLLPGVFAGKLLVFFLILGVNTSDIFVDSILIHYVNEELSSKNRATSLSTLNMLVSGFYIVILTISGPLQDMFSNRLVWSLLGIVALVTLLPAMRNILKHMKS